MATSVYFKLALCLSIVVAVESFVIIPRHKEVLAMGAFKKSGSTDSSTQHITTQTIDIDGGDEKISLDDELPKHSVEAKDADTVSEFQLRSGIRVSHCAIGSVRIGHICVPK